LTLEVDFKELKWGEKLVVVEVNDLKAYYITGVYGIKRTVRAVDGVSFKINENEVFGIAGESGCGKTTLIKAISATIKPPLVIRSGKVIYNFGNEKVNILSLSESKLRRIRWNYLSYVPQGSMNVLNPVRRIRKTFYDFIGTHREIKDKKEFEASIKSYLDALGLPPEVLSSYPHQLSGGMKQRVSIALATVLKPKVILADEPTTALDVVVQRGVIQLLKKIQEEQKNTLVLVTHDMAVHANIADRIAIMYAGKIVEEGKVSSIFENPLHPYTKYLISSLPKIGDKSYKISAPGTPPSLAKPPSGCRFHPRCPNVMSICKEKSPLLTSVGDEHKVACFLIAKEGIYEE